MLLFDKGRRQELYREFVDEASSLYIDALTRDTPDLSKTIKLYALISRMRVVSSSKVIEEALKVGQLIVDSYTEQNKSFEKIHAMVNERALDPLCAFSDACREELQLEALPNFQSILTLPRWNVNRPQTGTAL